ncbi:MAG: NTP transferase domain-containing protein [archaeon]
MNAIILAAGNQTRFKDDKPKGLMPINGKTIIDINIERLSEFVDKILIVTSYTNSQHFSHLKEQYDNVEIIKVEAGGGTGMSLALAKEEILQHDSRNYVLLWSDAMNCYPVILEDFKAMPDNIFVAPVVYEEDPYVDFIPDVDNTIKDIKFKKLEEEVSEKGLHDLSIFLVPRAHLKKVDHYMGEDFKDDYNFLYLYKYYSKFKQQSLIKAYFNINDLSFNTYEEYQEVVSAYNI